jgi:hypothetical protein
MGHVLGGSSVFRGPDDSLDMQWRTRFRINFHAMLLSNSDMLASMHGLVSQQYARCGNVEPLSGGNDQLNGACRRCNATCMR